MNFQQIKPQKVRGTLRPEYWTSLHWIAEEKYDGDRRISQFLPGKIRFTGTRESVDGSGFVEKSDNIPHLSKFPTRGHPLEGTVLDGEIVSSHVGPGGRSKFVTAIMGSSPEEAVRKQKAGVWLEYVVFDCLWYRGEDVRRFPFHQRRNLAEQAVLAWKNKFVRLSAQKTGAAKESRYREIVHLGGEGVVLKHRDGVYGDQKSWVKVKREETADCFISGYKPGKGKGKYEGQVGALELSQMSRMEGSVQGNMVHCERVVGFCSGMDDGTREEITRRPKLYTGHVVEIAHNGREPTGAFRHPRFKRFRDDKSPKDCIFDLEEK